MHSVMCALLLLCRRVSVCLCFVCTERCSVVGPDRESFLAFAWHSSFVSQPATPAIRSVLGAWLFRAAGGDRTASGSNAIPKQAGRRQFGHRQWSRGCCVWRVSARGRDLCTDKCSDAGRERGWECSYAHSAGPLNTFILHMCERARVHEQPPTPYRAPDNSGWHLVISKRAAVIYFSETQSMPGHPPTERKVRVHHRMWPNDVSLREH